MTVLDDITVEEYLEGEALSEVRHEYFDGKVFAMAGASAEHEGVSGNLFASLHAHLKGKLYKVFKDGMKLRLEVRGKDLFYYPDILVTCQPTDNNRFFRNSPKLIIEVLSKDENKDLVEKFFAYQRIESLEEYVVVRPDPKNREAFVFRKGTDWDRPLVLTEGSLDLVSVGLTLSMDDIFDGVG
ncbi:Uma2 family endonuclease [Phragmitibacter flavus]|uniref:Uma2 family endonuclease n=1 Tax=Phragmitibacter flavus TaxID=2576071 RepID=UPI00140985D4|nr:Uma2 family endonuclease [Phragmitibacter flavus]